MPANRVSDPHWFNADPDTDPDPAILLIADPDSGSGSRIRIPDPDPGFDDLKLKKITAETKNIFFFWSKTTIYLSLGLHKGRPSYRRNLQSSKRTSSTSKPGNSVLFSIFVGHFCPPGSGSGSAVWMRIRIRIQQLKLMRIHADPDPDTDPDPKPWPHSFHSEP